MNYKRSRHQVYLVNYHLIWCPKRRKPVLTGSVKTRLKEIIGEVSEELGLEILALEIQPDHIHLFVSTYPQLGCHKIIRSIKGRSSRLLRREFPELLRLPSLWTHSYFVSTAGNVSSETIKRYIEEQPRT
jgi:putative transposase